MAVMVEHPKKKIRHNINSFHRPRSWTNIGNGSGKLSPGGGILDELPPLREKNRRNSSKRNAHKKSWAHTIHVPANLSNPNTKPYIEYRKVEGRGFRDKKSKQEKNKIKENWSSNWTYKYSHGYYFDGSNRSSTNSDSVDDEKAKHRRVPGWR